jgi:capsular exopolysaccharide synthesis family protein
MSASEFGENGNQLPDNSLIKRSEVRPRSVRLYDPGENEEREMTLRDHWQILRKHVWLIVLMTGVMTAGVTGWLSLSPDYYEGKARVEIDLEYANPPPSETEVRPSPVDMDPAYFATQLEIMRSPMVLEQVVKALDLRNDPIYKKHMGLGGRMIRYMLRMSFLAKKDPLIETEHEGPLVSKALEPEATAEELRKSKELEPYVRALQKKLTVEPVKEPSSSVKDTRLVSITVNHPSPMLAAKLANAIADAVVYMNRARKLQAAKTTNAYLTNRIDELQAKIRNDEHALASYASKHNILSLDPNQNMAIERLTALNRQLVEAENGRKEAEANYNEVFKSLATSGAKEDASKKPPVDNRVLPQATIAAGGNGGTAGNQPITSNGAGDQDTTLTAATALVEQNTKQIADLESKVAELRQKRAQLLVGATEQWPEVQEVDEQIRSAMTSLEWMQQRATSMTITNLETKYKQEMAHEASIRAALESQRRLTQVQNEDAVDYRLLQQQIETEKNLLNGYLKRFDGNDVAQAAITSNIRVVDYAMLAGRSDAAGPFRLLYVMLVFLVSLALSICLAFFLEYWDDTIRTSDEVKQVMHLPTLAVIPVAPSVGALLRLQEPRLSLIGKAARPRFLFDDKVPVALIENYRRLRTAARSMMPEESKIIVVTSALAGEGKTTTAVNLAISLSQMHAPVLVIDGDTRKQRLSEVFRMGPFAGLQELLASPKELNGKEVSQVIQRHEPSGVFVLPAGRRVPNCAELLGSPQMAALVKIVAPRFSYILIDSPAITACVDTIILSKSADCVLMVVESGRSSRGIVLHSQAALEDAGAKLLGVVLNKAKGANHAYNYDYYSPKEVELRARTIEAPPTARAAGQGG